MQEPSDRRNTKAVPAGQLEKLTHQQVKQIDEALVSVGDYGEVRLIVQRGRLRYINRLESQKAWDMEREDQSNG